jgi:hypothetical protein
VRPADGLDRVTSASTAVSSSAYRMHRSRPCTRREQLGGGRLALELASQRC